MDYVLQRTKRKTITIYIKVSEVIVKAPLHLSKKAIDDFVLSKKDWIDAKIALQKESANRFVELYNFEQILFLGKRLTISFSTNCKKIIILNNYLLVPSAFSDKGTLAKKLKQWFVKMAKEHLLYLLNKSSDSLHIKYNSFSLTNAVGKWGSCDSFNNIKLNWRLLYFDEQYINYVITHELCHTIEHNHSKLFWNLVCSFDSEYKSKRKYIKDNGMLVTLYHD